MPTSGLFISYSKLLNSHLGNNLKVDRRASLPGSAPGLLAQHTQSVNSLPRRKSIQSLSSPLLKKRRGFGGYTTPQRIPSTSTLSLSNPAVSSLQRSSSFTPPNQGPNFRDSLYTGSPLLKRTSSISGTSNDSDHSDGIMRSSERYTHDQLDNSSSAAVVQAVAMAVSQVQIEAQTEIHGLRHKLDTTESELRSYKLQVEEQIGLLRELESTVVEFDNLKIAEEEIAKRNIPFLVDEIKKAHVLDLEERDKKIAHLKKQLEERRKEFRETLEILQTDMNASNASYVQEINNLQTKLKDSEVMAERVQKLEQYVRDMEASGITGTATNLPDQDAKAHIAKLAELENTLLEKEQKIQSVKDQLEQSKQRLKDFSATSILDDPSLQLAQLSEKLQQCQKKESEQNAQLEKMRQAASEYEKRIQHLESDLKKHQHHESEIARLNGIIAAQKVRELALEQELLELSFSKDPHTDLETTPRMYTSSSNQSTPKACRETLFSTTSYTETPSTPPRIDELLEPTPIQSPKPVSAVTGVSNVNGTAMSPGPLSPSAINIVSAITAATVNKRTSVIASLKLPSLSPAGSLKADPFLETDKKTGSREKWCGLCESQDHNILECPFGEEF